MEEPVPDWLTNEFLTECLQKEESNPSIVITDFKVSSAAPPGNNYGSLIFRLTVKYKDEEDKVHSKSFVMKSELTDGPVKDVFSFPDFAEPMFYKEFIPVASKLTEITFAPKSFFCSKPTAVILEDLKERGFLMADRIKQLDFDHCRLYAVAAASLHAVSFAVHKKNPDLIEAMGSEKFFTVGSKNEEAFKFWIENGFDCLAKNTEKITKYNKYCSIIRKHSKSNWDMLVEAHKPSKVMNVINQGDAWTTNMMFKYEDSGVVSEVKILDYQCLRYGSPANDLVCFIWSSANHDVRRNRLDDLYQIYLDAFNNKLKELGCVEHLSKEHFLENVKILNPLAIFMTGTFLPVLYDPAPIDFRSLTQKGQEKNPCDKYYNDNFCNIHLPKLLEQMELAGVFDYLEKYNK